MYKQLKFLPILIGIFLSFNLYSQQTNFGLKGGLTVANIGGDSEGTAFKLGFHAGGFLTFKSSETFSVQPEILYSKQGTQDSENGDAKINYNYVNIPIIFKIFPSEGFNFQFGPQLGILTSAKFSYQGVDVDVKDELNTTDFSAALGLGYSGEVINISARYNLGISNTTKSDMGGKYPNRVFQLSIGYIFK